MLGKGVGAGGGDWWCRWRRSAAPQVFLVAQVSGGVGRGHAAAAGMAEGRESDRFLRRRLWEPVFAPPEQRLGGERRAPPGRGHVHLPSFHSVRFHLRHRHPHRTTR